MIAPAFENGQLQQPVGAVQAEVLDKELKLDRRLVPSLQEPVAVVDHVAQHEHPARAFDEAAAELFRPSPLSDRVHLDQRVAHALVAVLVFEGVVVAIGSRQKGDSFILGNGGSVEPRQAECDHQRKTESVAHG